MNRLSNKIAVITDGLSAGFGIDQEFKKEGAFYMNNATSLAAYVRANAI